jgi:hypothetical protein
MAEIFPLLRKYNTSTANPKAKIAFAVMGSGQPHDATVGAVLEVYVPFGTSGHIVKARPLVNITRGNVVTASGTIHFVAGEIRRPPPQGTGSDGGLGNIIITLGESDHELPIGYGGPPDVFSGPPAPLTHAPAPTPPPAKKPEARK